MTHRTGHESFCHWCHRLTWEIIKRHRQNRAIVLTTHSMEEVKLSLLSWNSIQDT